MNKNSSGFALVVPVLLVLVIIGIVGFIVINNIRTPIIEKEVDERADIEANIREEFYSEKYISHNLGLIVNHRHDYEIHEKGNRITEKTGSNYVEVYDMGDSLTLKEAVEAKFLDGYPLDVCEVVVVDLPFRLQHYRPDLAPEDEIVEIVDNKRIYFDDPQSCPEDYSKSNTKRAFIRDMDFPDKFLFIEDGAHAEYWDVEFISTSVDLTFDTPKGGVNVLFETSYASPVYKTTEKVFDWDEFEGQRYVVDQSPIRSHYIEYWTSVDDLVDSITYEKSGDETNPGLGCFVEEKPVDIQGLQFLKEVCYYNPPPGVDSPKEFSEDSGILHEHCVFVLDNDQGALYFWSLAALGHNTCDTIEEKFTNLSITQIR